MQKALEEAALAMALGEVPVGCVIVQNGQIIASTRNQMLKRRSQTAHAEILALEEASQKLSSGFLQECDLYVTLEPCPMCAYAIKLSRMRRVYFGCYDEKNGALGGNINLASFGFGHKLEVYGGMGESQSAAMLKEFFQSKRGDKGPK